MTGSGYAAETSRRPAIITHSTVRYRSRATCAYRGTRLSPTHVYMSFCVFDEKLFF